MKRFLTLLFIMSWVIYAYAQSETLLNQETASVATTEPSQAEISPANTPKTDKATFIHFINQNNNTGREETGNQNKETTYFSDFLNKKAYAASLSAQEEKDVLRQQWKELLNIDIFYPYFKAKEVEDWASDKASVKLFKIKGRPKLEDGKLKYIFKVKF